MNQLRKRYECDPPLAGTTVRLTAHCFCNPELSAPIPAAVPGVSIPFMSWRVPSNVDSGGTLCNVPPLLLHERLNAISFDGIMDKIYFFAFCVRNKLVMQRLFGFRSLPLDCWICSVLLSYSSSRPILSNVSRSKYSNSISLRNAIVFSPVSRHQIITPCKLQWLRATIRI